MANDPDERLELSNELDLDELEEIVPGPATAPPPPPSPASASRPPTPPAHAPSIPTPSKPPAVPRPAMPKSAAPKPAAPKSVVPKPVAPKSVVPKPAAPKSAAPKSPTPASPSTPPRGATPSAPPPVTAKAKSVRPPPPAAVPEVHPPLSDVRDVETDQTEVVPLSELDDELEDANDELEALCEAQLREEADGERRARLSFELGRLRFGAGKHVEAADAFEAALRDAPDDLAALRGSRRACEALGRWDAVPELLDREVALTREPAVRGHLLRIKAEVLETRLGDPSKALAVYREALDLDPSHLGILKALERLHRRAGAWSQLAETYGKLAASVEDPSLRAAWLSLQAHLTETRLDDPATALQLHAAAVEANPHASASLTHLKRLGATRGDGRTWVAALRRQLALTQDPRGRHHVRSAIANVQERLGDLDGAVATYEAALEEQPDDRSMLEHLVRIHGARGHREREAEALSRLVGMTSTPTEVASLCHRIGSIHLHHLDDSVRARAWLERAFDADPRFAPAAHELSAQLEREQDWLALIAVLSGRARATVVPPEQAELLYRIGVLLEERLGRADEASARHARALGLDPTHHQAFLALTRLHAAAGRWHELAELFQRAADAAPHDAEAIAWLTRLGNVLEDRLSDAEGALLVYERVLARDPASLGALHAIQRAGERAGRHDRVVEALRAEAKLTRDPSRRDALLHRAATLEIDAVGDAGAGRRALQGILQTTPDHRPTLETLAGLETEAGHWNDLLQICERLLPLAGDAKERARIHLRIGELHDVQLGNATFAIAAYRNALREDPELDPARDALLGALEKTRAWQSLVSGLEEKLARAQAPTDRAALASRIGRLHEEHLNNPAAALAAYGKALEAEPLHRVALDARHRLLVAASDWAGLATALDAESQASEDAHTRGQAVLEATLVRVRHGGDQEAREAAAALLKARPDFIGAVLAAEEVGGRLSDRGALAAAFAKLAGASSDPRAVLAGLEELARLRRESDEDVVPVLQRIARLVPDDVGTLEMLADQAASAGDDGMELAMASKLATLASDPSVAANHQTRIGYVLLGRADAAGALAAFRAALGLHGRNIGASRGLTLAARAMGDAEALRQAARQERLVTRDVPMAVRVSLEAAQLYVDVGREEEGASCYSEALEMDPDSPEAATGLMATMMRFDAVPRLVERLVHAAYAAKDAGRAVVLHLCVAQLQADILHDLPASIAAVRRALALRPNHEHANRQLAVYLERNEQWTLAVEAIESSLPNLSEAATIDARLRLARIREQHLLELDQAAEDLRGVLAVDGNHGAALSALARVERLRGNDAQALELVRKLLEVAEGDTGRAVALAEMAELERARGQHVEAAKAALEAMAIQGPAGIAGDVYRDLVRTAPQHAAWDGYQQALIRFLQRPKTARGNKAAAYRELARVSEMTQGGLEHAIATLRRGATALPEDSSISLALVGALRRAGQEAPALEEVRRLLGVDAREPAAWRALAEIFVAHGEPQGASVALAPLVAMQQASTDEQRHVASRHARVAVAPPRTFARPGLQQLFGNRTLDDPWAFYLPAIAEVVAKLEGIDYARWGLSKRDRLRQGDTHHVRVMADRIAEIFGEAEFDLFILDRDSYRHGFVLAGSPPAVMIPASIAQAPDAVLAFELARPIALLARQLHPLDHVDDEKLETLLVAVAQQFDPSFALRPSLDEDELDALEREARRVGKAIGFFSRGRIQEAVQRFTMASPQQFGEWARLVRLEASKTALLVADDLVAIVEAAGEAIGPDNEATELARFWVAEPAMMFRRAIAQRLG